MQTSLCDFIISNPEWDCQTNMVAFIIDNPTLDNETIVKILKLEIGESCEIGGGASGIDTITRQNNIENQNPFD